MLTLELEIKQNDIMAGFLGELARRLNSAIANIKGRFLSSLQEEIEQLLTDSPEGASLLSSDTSGLRAQLGVANPDQAIREIAEAIIGTASYVLDPFVAKRTTITGGLEIGLLNDDLQALLALQSGSFVSSHGRPVPWLRWLLLMGATPIVRDYRFVPGRPGRNTGLGLGRMVRTEGQNWGVTPASMTGTRNDNWVTRSLQERLIAPRIEHWLDVYVNQALSQGGP